MKIVLSSRHLLLVCAMLSLLCKYSYAFTVDHYQITHTGQGNTCQYESILVEACADKLCSALITDSVSLDFLVNAESTHLTFTGSTTVNVNHTVAETVAFSINNTTVKPANRFACYDGTYNTCQMVFTHRAFKFIYDHGVRETIPNQQSGTVFGSTLKLKAVENVAGVCTDLFHGQIPVNLSLERISPKYNAGLNFSVNGKNISALSTVLDFVNGIAEIPEAIYHDAGRIRLHANYDINGVRLSAVSNAFWVSPAKLVISAATDTTPLNAYTAISSKTLATHQAGENFTLKVTAYNAAAPALVTPNYFPGQLQLKLKRTGPKSTSGVDGDFTYNSVNNHDSITTSKTAASVKLENVTLAKFSAGISTYTKAKYSEVGLLKLDVRDSAYGDGTMKIEADAINIGRFTPAYFKQTVYTSGGLTASCMPQQSSAITYIGQRDLTNGDHGDMTYLVRPKLAITPYNKQGVITQNYVGDFMKLSANKVIVNRPSKDKKAKGVDKTSLKLNANMHQGSVERKPNGVLHYTFSDKDNYYYHRTANALVRPFEANIEFSVSSIEDADLISLGVDNATESFMINGVNISFGRLVLENSFGPETQNLIQPLQLQHYDGDDFIATTSNHCESYDATNIVLSRTQNNLSLTPSDSFVIGGKGAFILGRTRAIRLNAPKDKKQGEIRATYNSSDWLKYNWDNDGNFDNDPYAIATFGVYRGSDRIISWREIYK